MVLEENCISSSKEDDSRNSLGASLTWIPPEPQAKPRDKNITYTEAFQQVWATLSVHSMVIMVGMTLGFSAILIPQLQQTDSDIPITKSDASWLASIVSIVAPIGSLSAGPVVQWLGSKKTIRLSLIPYACGWLLISFANGLPMLLVGRLITGLATTFGNTPCIVYITEVSSPHMRSMLTATGPAIASLGILTVYVLGWLFSWRTVALIPAAWNLVCLVFLATIPESPVWLISHGRFSEACKAIHWFHRVKMLDGSPSMPNKVKGLIKSIDINGKTDIIEDGICEEDDEIASRRKRAEMAYALLMEEHYKKNLQGKGDNHEKLSGTKEKLLSDGSAPGQTITKSQNMNQLSLMDRFKILFTHSTGLKPLLILTTIFLFQQYAGVYITLFYAVNVFKEMGGGAMDDYIASIMVGVVRFSMALVNIWLFRRVGRRPLCLFSAFGMTICMLVSGTSLFIGSRENKSIIGDGTKFGESTNSVNWSSTAPMLFTPSVYEDASNGEFLNVNLSSYSQNQPLMHRSERSLNESSSEPISLNNLMSGNSSSDAPSDYRRNKENRTKTRKDSTSETPFPAIVETAAGNVSHMDVKNDTNKTIAMEKIMNSGTSGTAVANISGVITTACMLLYVCVCTVGFLAIPWTITAELFPTEIRSLANSIILSVANVLLFSALQAYPFMLDTLEAHGVLWLFAAVSAVGGLFFYFFLPETHGRNLSEIEKYFTENTIYTYPCKKE